MTGAAPRHEATIRVRYEETDAMGVVYHGNYLRYFEVARVELLRALGADYRGLEDRGHRLAVVEARAAYRAPARFDDLLAVQCWVERLRPTRVDIRYRIARDGRLLCEGETVLACLDREGRPARLPEEVRVALDRAVQP